MDASSPCNPALPRPFPVNDISEHKRALLEARFAGTSAADLLYPQQRSSIGPSSTSNRDESNQAAFSREPLTPVSRTNSEHAHNAQQPDENSTSHSTFHLAGHREKFSNSLAFGNKAQHLHFRCQNEREGQACRQGACCIGDVGHRYTEGSDPQSIEKEDYNNQITHGIAPNAGLSFRSNESSQEVSHENLDKHAERENGSTPQKTRDSGHRQSSKRKSLGDYLETPSPNAKQRNKTIHNFFKKAQDSCDIAGLDTNSKEYTSPIIRVSASKRSPNCFLSEANINFDREDARQQANTMKYLEYDVKSSDHSAYTKRIRQLESALIAKEKELNEARDKYSESDSRCKSLEAEGESWKKQIERFQQSLNQQTARSEALEEELKKRHTEAESSKEKYWNALRQYVTESARLNRQLDNQRLKEDSHRYGQVLVERSGTLLTEVWEDGELMRSIVRRQTELSEMKDELEKKRKALRKRSTSMNEASGNAAEKADCDSIEYTEEFLKVRQQVLKREEDALQRERERLEREKYKHIRSLKRLRDQNMSKFRKFPRMGSRQQYVLFSLLGKGGFSEVYKAFDLENCREVACKIHQLNFHWTEERRESYIKHASREYDIHKNLDHPNVVRLYDIFEIDNSSFCTILEYCEGHDLDEYLKEQGALSEREARVIIAQLFEGLRYLNKPQGNNNKRVIHYDLKPGNLLFTKDGTLKITDFGLSKCFDDSKEESGMELTSQGAGTYWYLPPECFESKGSRISSKVDVWAAGVILYQMIYGRKPFGHELSQERILREKIISTSSAVEFPSRPQISQETKDFLLRCLEPNQFYRPDVLQAANDPYITTIGTYLKTNKPNKISN